MTNKTRHRSRARLLMAGAVSAVVAISGLGIGGTPAVGAPSDPLAPLSLVRARESITGYNLKEDKVTTTYYDLGVHAVAGSEPIEIHASRPNYKEPVTGKWITVKDGVRTSVPMPAGTVTDFGGLKKFTSVQIQNYSTGKTVKKYDVDFCPNSWGTARTRRDAPSASPYPYDCSDQWSSNPFVLGAVFGIQAGWNAPLESMKAPTGKEKPLSLKVGKYTVITSVNKRYVDFFQLPAGEATETVTMNVIKANRSDIDRAMSARTKAGLPAPAASRESAKPQAQADVHAHDARPGAIRTLQPAARRPATMAAADIPAGPLPDLRSLPAWDIALEQGKTNGKKNRKWYINFGATVWNAGNTPLVVDGFRRPDSEIMDAYQYFFDADGKQVGSVEAGTMEWDKRDGHTHWHFTDFAQYRLLTADKKVAVRSGKEAFCLANTDAVDYTVPGANWRPGNTNLSTACGEESSLAIREVLDAGSGDTYDQNRPGQSFNVTTVPNGTYYIEVMANPAQKLTESSTANNSALRKVTLSGTKAKRKLTVSAVHGIKG